MNSLAATADNILGNSSNDLLKIKVRHCYTFCTLINDLRCQNMISMYMLCQITCEAHNQILYEKGLRGNMYTSHVQVARQQDIT